MNALMFATYMLEVHAVGLQRVKEYIEKPIEVRQAPVKIPNFVHSCIVA